MEPMHDVGQPAKDDNDEDIEERAFTGLMWAIVIAVNLLMWAAIIEFAFFAGRHLGWF